MARDIAIQRLEVKELPNRLQRYSSLIRNNLAPIIGVTIVLGLLFGVYAPESAKLFKPFVPLPLFFMLYPMMVGIHLEQVEREALNAKVILGVLAINFVLSPLLAAAVANVLFAELDPLLVVGFVLKLTVPCSGMVVAWTGFARGRTETALIIVTFSFLLGILLIPVWMSLLVGVYVTIDIWLMTQKILIIIVLPLIAGLVTRQAIIRRWGLHKFKSIKPVFPTVSSLGMFTIVFIMMAVEANTIVAHLEYVVMIALGILLIYPLLFVLSLGYSRAVGLDFGDAIAKGYGVTSKNHSITIALALTTFGELAALPAAFAPIIQIPLMLLILKYAPRIRAWLDGPESMPRHEHEHSDVQSVEHGIQKH